MKRISTYEVCLTLDEHSLGGEDVYLDLTTVWAGMESENCLEVA